MLAVVYWVLEVKLTQTCRLGQRTPWNAAISPPGRKGPRTLFFLMAGLMTFLQPFFSGRPFTLRWTVSLPRPGNLISPRDLPSFFHLRINGRSAVETKVQPLDLTIDCKVSSKNARKHESGALTKRSVNQRLPNTHTHVSTITWEPAQRNAYTQMQRLPT